MSLLRCPHCRFSIRPRAQCLAPHYCPRCLARRRVAQPLHAVDEEPRRCGQVAPTDSPGEAADDRQHSTHATAAPRDVLAPGRTHVGEAPR